MRPLTFTLLDSHHDRSCKPETRDWEDWVPLLTTHVQRGNPGHTSSASALSQNKNGPSVVLADIPAGAPRLAANVRQIDGFAFDFDDVADDADLETILKPLNAYEWIIYTTHRHGSAIAGGKTKVRVVMPLAIPVAPQDYPRFWAAMSALVGGRTDQATKDPARLFYLPSTFDLSLAWAHRNVGQWFDPNLILKTAISQPRAPQSDREKELLALLERGRANGVGVTAMARAIAKGEPFAEAGERHNACLAVTLWLAQRSQHAPFDDETISRVFQASYEAFRLRDGEADFLDPIRCYRGALEKIGSFSGRDKMPHPRQSSDTDVQASDVQTQPGKYTTEELKAICRAQRLPENPALLSDRWIVVLNDRYYLLGPSGGYHGPYLAGAARVVAIELLERAPVELFGMTEKGALKRISIQALVEDYGRGADRATLDLTARTTRFDAESRTMVESASYRRDLVPLYDSQIDKWLHLLTGEQHNRIQDWLACVPHLDRLLCALYIGGKPGAGKNMLAHGLAKLWHVDGTPTDIDRALSDFNDDIARCPLVWADETLPKWWKGQDVTTKIRSMVSISNRTLSRKFLPGATMVGAIRLLITANNEFLLKVRGSVNADDLEAISQRFIYVHATPESAAFLESIPKATIQAWINGGIAAHVLWLSHNRQVVPGGRFWVQGEVAKMHRMLAISSEWTSKCCDFLVRYLTNPAPIRSDGAVKDLIRTGDGRLLVNEQAIVDCWGRYITHDKSNLEASQIGSALRAISHPDRPQLRCDSGKRVRYRDIKIDLLMGWVEANYGDVMTISNTIWGGNIPHEELMKILKSENLIDLNERRK